MLRNFINSIEKLESLFKKNPNIPDAETAKIAIVRPTSHFTIETPDNPDMVHTLELQEAFVNEKLTFAEVEAKENNAILTEEQKLKLIRQFQNEFQHNLSLKALEEQNGLLEILKKNGIMTVPLLEDKVTLPIGKYDLDLMSGNLKKNIIEFNCDVENGLQYRVIGLDEEEKNGLIPWDKLHGFPKTNEEVLDKKKELLPKILKHTSKAGHTPSGFYPFTDQIFATDTGQYCYVSDKKELWFMPANFKNEQRMGEQRLAVVQAENLGAKIKTLLDEAGNQLIFEGGDIRQMPGKKLFFIGQGLRSDSKTAEAIAEMTGYIVVPIVLLQPQFYHLDCCFLPLPNDAAMIYEGEYELDEENQPKIDSNGWPMLIPATETAPGTETMDAKSRALIRSIYPADKLITITKEEALAFATNAAILQDKDGRFKMFVNGEHDRDFNTTIDLQEQQAKLLAQTLSLSHTTYNKILAATDNQMDIIETPFNTMHGSGGSVRCTIQEVACSKKTLDLYLNGDTPASDAIDRIEKTRKLPKRDQFFTHPKSLPLVAKEEPIDYKMHFKIR